MVTRLKTGYKRHNKAAAKSAVLPKSVVPAEMAEVDNYSLVNSPYEIFAPLLELIITPWRIFFPFTPWSFESMQRLRNK